MEVHHHAHLGSAETHSPGKKWTHYLWEFFMLFLAVTLGFFVENQREHFVEHKREIEYINSILEDLKEDTASFARVIELNTIAGKKIDTLINLLQSKRIDSSARKIYYMARLIPIYDEDLVCQDKTFEQLKGSGNLRLIRNQITQNKIGGYYQISKVIERGPTPMQFQNRRDLFLSYEKLFNAATLQEIMKDFNSRSSSIPDDHFVLLTHDPAIINGICTRFHIMYSTKKVVSLEAKRFIKEATALIDYLQKEYHIK